MKYILLALALSVLPLEAKTRTVQQEAELRDWIIGIQKLAHEAQAEADAAEKEALESRAQSAISLDRLAKVQAEYDAQVLETERQRTAKEKERARADKAEKESNRRGNFIGWLSAAAMAFLAMQFMGLVPKYGWALPIVGAIAGYFLARLII